MTVEERNEDVFEALENREGTTLFLHGCNMQGVMGSGVAKGVKERWPYVFETYKNFLEGQGQVTLGGIVVAPSSPRPEDGKPPLFVANALTQENYGADGKRYATSEAILQALDGIERTFAGKSDDMNFVAVRVGCGLGGLDWESEVKPLFETSDLDWTIYYIEN